MQCSRARHGSGLGAAKSRGVHMQRLAIRTRITKLRTADMLQRVRHRP